MLVLPRCGQHSEGTTLLWGSCYPDAPDIFLSDEELLAIWGTGERKWLFAEDPCRQSSEEQTGPKFEGQICDNEHNVEKVLAGRLYPVQTIADKTLWTDRPVK